MLPLILHTAERFKKYVRINANQIIEHLVTHYEVIYLTRLQYKLSKPSLSSPHINCSLLSHDII